MIFATYKFLISICSPILKNKIQPEHWGGGGQRVSYTIKKKDHHTEELQK